MATAAICSFAALVFLAPVALAAPTLDLSNLPTSGLNALFPIDNGPDETAQIVTADRSGLLTDVTAYLSSSSATAPLQVQITTVVGGFPDLSFVIGSGSVDPSSLTSSVQQFTIHLNVPAPVITGQQYGILFTTSSSNEYGLWTDSNNNYPGGDAVYDEYDPFLGSTGWLDSNADIEFQTYVDSSPQVATGSPRGSYCTAAGDTTDGGAALTPRTFVNLDDGQVNTDPDYAGAVPANFVAGEGLTCDPPPAGYARAGFATSAMNVDADTYPYYATG